MLRLGVMLIVVCALAGGAFYYWSGPPKDTKAPANKHGDVDYGPYMDDLQRRIKRNWFPPKGDESKRVVCMFKVHSNGEVTNIRISKPSDSKGANDAALTAIIKTAPVRPLPSGSPPDVDIQFTFDYNVYKGKKQKGFRAF